MSKQTSTNYQNKCFCAKMCWKNVFFSILLLPACFCGENDTNCTLYKGALTTAISDFTYCALEHARPITICESCVDYYINLQDSYKNLSTFSNENGPCIKEYTDLDRLQIIQTLYKNSYDLWNRAKCYECFDIVNGTLTHDQSQETKTFNDLLNSTLQCIIDTNDDENLYCTLCIDIYLELNAYYKSISNINEKIGVCMDIVDLMNSTRAKWSVKCCEYRKNNEYIFLITTGLACAITLLFYLLAKFCTDMKKPEIFKQSRFAESLNHNPQ